MMYCARQAKNVVVPGDVYTILVGKTEAIRPLEIAIVEGKTALKWILRK
jgi:hypothetical protein